MNNFGIADNSEYLKLAEELKCIAEDRKQKVAVELLDRSIKQFSTGTFSLAVLGMVKRGKSTFCNALLGANSDKYAPVGKTPVSNAITFFEKGPSRISVSFFNGDTSNISLEEIPSYITEQQNPGNKRQVSHIKVSDNFPRLPEGVILMDTPGEGSFNQHHDDLLFKYLPMVDAGIFLITAYSPVTESELDFLQQVMKHDAQKIFFAINRADQTDEDELNDAIEHNLHALSQAGIAVRKIYPISAKRALDGDWINSGMECLFKDIDAYLAKEKYRVPRLRFMNRVTPVISPLYKGICEEIEARTKNAEELKKEIDELTSKGTALEEEQNNQLDNVKSVWIQAENKLAQEIESSLHYIESQMNGYIDSIGFFNCTNAKMDFCNKFAQLVNNVMYPLFRDFEARIMSAINGMPIHFSGINMETNTKGYNNAFMSGTTCGGWKIALTAGVTIISVPIGALIHLHTVSSIKSDLHRQLPAVINDMREYFRSQMPELSCQRDDIINELEHLFQLEMSPTIQALQDALESQGSIDHAYDEHLVIVKNMLESIQNTAQDLQKSLEN